ncbi:chromosome partitioning protein ParA [Lactiplantibacillus plantarum]|uniref:ParA family protein n=1 Tax=Lactiplantibacillus TaxID=2767842 RepID=UPI000FDBF3D1|nr:ParA family protein [Lactiplantibacillus plantarum]GCD87480.1 chromosome partitioning protein ParA [Lactiplantibacillus plantarum]
MSEPEEARQAGKVVSFINMKGGVGKTTLCKEIGYTLADKFNKSVLFIDVDPQANLTQSLFDKYDFLNQELYDELDPKQQKGITISDKTISRLLDSSNYEPAENDVIQVLDSNKNLALIPGDLNTIFLERTNGGSARENAIDNFLIRNSITTKYEYILIDCPPTYSFYTTAAFNASDYYIVPVGVDPYSTLGIDLLEKVVKKLRKTDIRRYSSKKLKNLGVIFDSTAKSSSANRQLELQKSRIKNSKKLSKYNLFFFSNDFIYNYQFREDISYFILDHDNMKSTANINKLTQEFIDRVNSI